MLARSCICFVAFVLCGVGSAFAGPTSRPASRPVSRPASLPVSLPLLKAAKGPKARVSSLVNRMLATFPQQLPMVLLFDPKGWKPLSKTTRGWLIRSQLPVAKLLSRAFGEPRMWDAISKLLGAWRPRWYRLFRWDLSAVSHRIPVIFAPISGVTTSLQRVKRTGFYDPKLSIHPASLVPMMSMQVTFAVKQPRKWLARWRASSPSLRTLPGVDRMFGVVGALAFRAPQRSYVIAIPRKGFVQLAYVFSSHAKWSQVLSLFHRWSRAKKSRRLTPAFDALLRGKGWLRAYVHGKGMRDIAALSGLRQGLMALASMVGHMRHKLLREVFRLTKIPFWLFETPYTSTEDMALLWSLRERSVALVSSLTQSGKRALQPTLRVGTQWVQLKRKGRLMTLSLSRALMPLIERVRPNNYVWMDAKKKKVSHFQEYHALKRRLARAYAEGGFFMHPILLSEGWLQLLRAWYDLQEPSKRAFFKKILSTKGHLVLDGGSSFAIGLSGKHSVLKSISGGLSYLLKTLGVPLKLRIVKGSATQSCLLLTSKIQQPLFGACRISKIPGGTLASVLFQPRSILKELHRDPKSRRIAALLGLYPWRVPLRGRIDVRGHQHVLTWSLRAASTPPVSLYSAVPSRRYATPLPMPASWPLPKAQQCYRRARWLAMTLSTMRMRPKELDVRLAHIRKLLSCANKDRSLHHDVNLMTQALKPLQPKRKKTP